MPVSCDPKKIPKRTEFMEKKYAGTTFGNFEYLGISRVIEGSGGRLDFMVDVRCKHCGAILEVSFRSLRTRKRDDCTCANHRGRKTPTLTDLEKVWPAVVKAGREVMDAYVSTSALRHGS